MRVGRGGGGGVRQLLLRECTIRNLNFYVKAHGFELRLAGLIPDVYIGPGHLQSHLLKRKCVPFLSIHFIHLAKGKLPSESSH